MLGNRKLKGVYRLFAISFIFNVLMTPGIEAKKKIVKPINNFQGLKSKNNIKKVQKPQKSQKISDLKNQKAEIMNKIGEVQDKINSELKTQKELKSEINKIQLDIDQLNLLVYNCKVQLDDQEQKINKLEELKYQKELQIKEKKKKLGDYIRAIYTGDDLDSFRILFGSRDLNDFIDKAQLLKIVMFRISSLFEEIVDDINSIKNAIKEIEIIKKEKEKNLEEYNIKKSELALKMAGLDKLYDKSKESQENLKCELDADNEALNELNSQINDYYESLRKQIPTEKSYIPKYDGNLPRLLWPVAGFRRITSNFSDRENRKSSHGAIDIGSNIINNKRQGIFGQPVRAPIDMIITSAGRCGGYGNLVTGMFEHKGSKFCLYFGHLSQITAKRGITVKRGTIIGFVGNTGFSTGPHLHFEVRKNGTRIDPLSFPFDY